MPRRLPQICDRFASQAVRIASSNAVPVFASLALISKILVGLYDDWNNVRLAPSFALAMGYDIYGRLGEGVVLDNVYPPLRALFYLPAVIAATPNQAIAIGVLLSAIVGIAPLVWLLSRSASDSPANGFSRMLFAAAFFHLYWSGVMTSLWDVQGELLGLALCAVACICTLRGSRSGGLVWIMAAGLAAALAPWSKQTLAPFGAVPFVYLLAVGKAGLAFRYGAAFAAGSAVATGSFVAWFGFDNLWHTLVELPARHPWQISRPGSALVVATQEGLDNFLIPFVVLFAVAILIAARATADSRRQEWLIFLAGAVALFPMSVLGRVKVGGAPNHFGLVEYFLTLSAVAVLLHIYREWGRARGWKTALETLLAIFIIAQIGRTLPDLARIPRLIAERSTAPSQAAWRALRDSASAKNFYPWHPVAHAMAEASFPIER